MDRGFNSDDLMQFIISGFFLSTIKTLWNEKDRIHPGRGILKE
jgi:hypothetical protein